MRKTILRPAQQRSGGVYSLSVALGRARAASGGSDHTGASGTGQTIILAVLKPGDVVLPGSVIDIVEPYVHAGTMTASLGITGTVDRFAAATDVKSTTVKAIVGTTATHALSYTNATASDVNLIATFTAGSGNVSDATAGQLQVRIPIVRRADRVE